MNPKIKILVAYHKPATLLKSEIFVPIQTGRAIEDETDLSTEEKVWLHTNMIGDNTGENISEKNNAYAELCAVYWAWKNQQADYYGLCHYRRLFSCNKNSKQWATGEHCNGCLETDYLDDESQRKFKFDEISLRQEIEGYDAVFMIPISLKKLQLVSNYQAMQEASCWHNMADVEMALDLIKTRYPEMATVTDEYFYNYPFAYLYNCFVMKKEIFDRFCNWLFPVLFELEKRIDPTYYTQYQQRSVGLLAEHLFGVWALWLKKQGKYQIKELPLLFIKYPNHQEELKPQFKDQPVAIAMTSSNEYVPYLSVCLESLKEHCRPQHKYDIIIFERSITEENKVCLRRQIGNQRNISLRFVNPLYLLRSYHLTYPPHYALECFFRLTSPLLLKNYSKIVFTDVDLIFQRDIHELCQTDLQGFPLAACRDLMWGAFLNYPNADWKKYAVEQLHLEQPYQYYNTGVLVFNVKQFNQFHYAQQVLNLASQNKFRILEQDALNAFFKTHIKYLDTKWNVPTACGFYKEIISFMPDSFRKQYKRDVQLPCIVHFAGALKPWKTAQDDMTDLWWQYARKTPFYEVILQRLYNQALDCKLKELANYRKLYWKYKRYCIKRYFSWGETRKRYKQRIKEIKEKLRQTYQMR